MNTTQAENLRVLIRHMETNVKEPLRMARVNDACGTPACAMGHARTIRALNLTRPLEDSAVHDFGMSLDADAKNSWGRLFGGHLVIRRPLGLSSYVSNPTPQEWAKEARRVLAEQGYSMDAPHDDFAAFMAKVREPVLTDADARAAAVHGALHPHR